MHITYKRNNMKQMADFPRATTIEASRQWNSIFRVLRKKCQHRNLYPVKSPGKNDHETGYFAKSTKIKTHRIY